MLCRNRERLATGSTMLLAIQRIRFVFGRQLIRSLSLAVLTRRHAVPPARWRKSKRKTVPRRFHSRFTIHDLLTANDRFR